MERKLGYTLDTLEDPEEPTLVEQIDMQLQRISGGALDYPSVRPRCEDDPTWLIRIGNEDTSVLCDAMNLLDVLKVLPDGAALGHPYEAPAGSVWRVLLDLSLKARLW